MSGEWGEEYDDLDELPAAPGGPTISDEDFELLELAARALGATRIEIVEGENWLNLHFDDAPAMPNWNPLVFNDNALVLAVRLRISVEWRDFGRDIVVAAAKDAQQGCFENLDGDAIIATRRAITRAAAEIGKTTLSAIPE